MKALSRLTQAIGGTLGMVWSLMKVGSNLLFSLSHLLNPLYSSIASSSRKRGTRFESRRLTLIKNAARRKHCLEITRQAFENVAVIEMGIDPFGNKIDAIPILEEFTDTPMVSSDFPEFVNQTFS
ncbi:hypothetical protein GQ457_04G003970 [Hibiscus cannabinus]